MAKYRKKPVTIEAIQWTGKNYVDIRKFAGPDLYFYNGELYIKTLEGVHSARIGDFIIKGVHGECYPCKPDIFAETYEPAYTTQETLRPTGRCRYCSPNDGAGLQWDFEDIEVSVTLQSGVLTICNQYGDEAEMPIRYCPNCGAKMEG